MMAIALGVVLLAAAPAAAEDWRVATELNGVDWDSLLLEIQNGVNGKLVEVEDQEDNERVEIFVD